MNEKYLLEQTKLIQDIFNKHDKKIWLNWGTLLGVVRDKKLIDDDIDLATLFNLSLMNDIKKDLVNNGFEIEELPNNIGINLRKKNFRAGIGYYDIDAKNKVLCQDMLPVLFHDRFFAKKLYYLLMKKHTSNFTYWFFRLFGGYYIKSVIPVEFVVPEATVEFNGIDFFVPSQSEKYLEYLYGYNWKTPIKDYPHFVAKDNLEYYEGAFSKFIVTCPHCGHSQVLSRSQNVLIVKAHIICIECKKRFVEHVFIKGTIKKKVIN